MAEGPAPLVTVRGLVRSVERAVQIDRTTNEERVFGVRASVLTEPDGGFLEVLIGTRTMPPDEAGSYRGQQVEWLVSVGAWAGRNGNAGLQVNFVRDLAQVTAGI